MKLAIFTSCLLAEIVSGYVFVNVAVNSGGDLWQFCMATIIVSLVVQVMVLKNE